MTAVVIRADSYRAKVALDLFPELPLSNIRKLFRIMFRAAWENESSIQTINDWLSKAILSAKADWGTATLEYGNRWKDLKTFSSGLWNLQPQQRRRKIAEQRRLNRELTATLKAAKTAYDRLVKIQSEFLKLKEKYHA